MKCGLGAYRLLSLIFLVFQILASQRAGVFDFLADSFYNPLLGEGVARLYGRTVGTIIMFELHDPVFFIV